MAWRRASGSPAGGVEGLVTWTFDRPGRKEVYPSVGRDFEIAIERGSNPRNRSFNDRATISSGRSRRRRFSLKFLSLDCLRSSAGWEDKLLTIVDPLFRAGPLSVPRPPRLC